jgi:hypothetical protein
MLLAFHPRTLPAGEMALSRFEAPPARLFLRRCATAAACARGSVAATARPALRQPIAVTYSSAYLVMLSRPVIAAHLQHAVRQAAQHRAVVGDQDHHPSTKSAKAAIAMSLSMSRGGWWARRAPGSSAGRRAWIARTEPRSPPRERNSSPRRRRPRKSKGSGDVAGRDRTMRADGRSQGLDHRTRGIRRSMC